MMSHSLAHISLFYAVVFFLSGQIAATAAAGTSFNSRSLSHTDLSFLGEAYMINKSFPVSFRSNLLVPTSASGMVLYNKPIQFRSPGSPFPVSFSTNFSFVIHDTNKDCNGDGLAFVITPNGEVVGDGNGFLGIPSGAFAIEFDTKMDVKFQDINGNHVGLDLQSIVSAYVADLDLVDVNLRSGGLVNVWVEYFGLTQNLNIFISHEKQKPKLPVLAVSVNLSEYVNDFMYVGFTGSRQESTEIQSVKRWRFTSNSDTKFRPTIIPNNPPHVVKSPRPLPMPQTKPPTTGSWASWVAGGALLVFMLFGITWYVYPDKINIKCIFNCFNK